jgi:hypothetical protein
VLFAGKALQQHSCESRFADAELARAAPPGLHRPLPLIRVAAAIPIQFLSPPDERGKAARGQRLEAALDRTRPQRRPGPHPPGDALEIPGPKVPKLEQIAKKPSRALGDDDRVRLGDALQARREIRRFMPRSRVSPDPIRSPTTASPVAIPTRVCSEARVLSPVKALLVGLPSALRCTPISRVR